jgi:hypothetical protein
MTTGAQLTCIEAGWQKPRADAKRQGEGALFRLLASGWKTPIHRIRDSSGTLRQ